MRKTIIAIFAAAAAALSTGAVPVAAHEGEIGSGGPFSVRIDESTLPAAVEPRLGNGELELHVPAGVEVIAIGVENEPMAKVDAEGNMFGNKNSPTWWLGLDGGNGTPPAGLDPTAEPEWEWVQAGGSLQYHEHRIHFMAAGIDPSIADGADVFSFTLPFLVDGAEAAISGALVFDPSLDPAGAERLRAGEPLVDAVAATDAESSSSATLAFALVGIVVVAFAGGAVVVIRRRS